MAQRTKLAAVLNGLVRNIDITADELVLDSVRFGGLAGTLLTKTILDSLIANSHASGSDNQNIVAGSGLTGGGSGASVTLDVNVDNSTIEINTDQLRIKDGAISASKLNASAITGQTAETSADNADMLLVYDDSAAALKKMSRANFLSGTTTDEQVKITASDTTAGYLDGKLVVDVGTNATNALEKSVVNPGADEDLRIRFDQSKVDHGSIAGLGDDDHTIYTKADGTRAFTGNQSMGSFNLTNVADPIGAQDAATKNYVDTGFATKALDNLFSTAINADLLPDTNLSKNLGSSSLAWTNVWGRYFQYNGGGKIDLQSTVKLIPQSASPYVDLNSVSGTNVKIRFWDSTNTNSVLMSAPGSVTSPVYFTLPASQGNNGDVLADDGSGNLSWVDRTYTADGDGIQVSANQFSLELDGSTLSKSATGLKVASGGITDTEVSASAAIALSKLAALTANRALISNGSGVISVSTVTDTELGYLSGVTSAVQTQIDGKLSLSGGTMTGNIAMSSNKVTGLGTPTNAGDAATKSYVDNLVSGAVWLNPIHDPDLIDDSLNTPPGSPVYGDTYIAGATPTGAWAGNAGRAFTWNGSSWVDLLGRAVIVGDRFGVSMESATAGAGGLAGQDNKIAQITTATPGSIAYTFTTPSANQAVYVPTTNSTHFGHSYNYNGTSWVEFAGPGTINAGIGLAWNASTLNVNLGAGISQLPSDEVGIDVHASGGLFTTVDNSTSDTTTAAQLAVKLDGSSLSKSGSGLRVATNGVNGSMIRLAYGEALRTRNSANTADVNMFQVWNPSDWIAVQQHLIPAVSSSQNLGFAGNRFDQMWSNDVHAKNFKMFDGSYSETGRVTSVSATLPSGDSATSMLTQFAAATGALAVYTYNQSGGVTRNVNIESGNVTSGAFASGDIKLQTGTSTGTRGKVILNGSEIDVTSKKITNLADPTAAQDAVTKAYADALVPTKVAKSFLAGESFSANTSYAVRIAMTGETAGRVYKADFDASVSDKFYAYGMIEGNGAAAKSAGDPVTVVMLGTITLGSSDTNFAAGEIGQSVNLKAAGAWDAVSQITYNTNEATYRLGMVQEVDKILVGNMQLVGIN